MMRLIEMLYLRSIDQELNSRDLRTFHQLLDEMDVNDAAEMFTKLNGVYENAVQASNN